MVKVFVGNLAFKTTEADLGKEFAVAGNVVTANIITRGPRSLGYGFVEFNSEEEANKAVTLLNKKEIDGRAVNVEVAKPRVEGEENKGEGQIDSGATRGGFRRRGGFRGRGRGGIRGGRGRGGFRGGFRGGAAEGSEEVEDTNRPRGGFRRGRGGRGGRGGRSPRADQPDNRVESKTTLFVANLPFALDDEGFGKVFSDASLKFKSAHVVKKRNGRSKGFGFAEFDSEDDQKKALTALDKKQIAERDLVVKIALTDDAAKQTEEQKK